MRPASIEAVDDFWATYLGCSVGDLLEPRVTVVTHGDALRDYRGVYLLRGSVTDAAACVISAPDDRVRQMREAAADHPPEGVADAAFLARVIGSDVQRVIGPASLAYADELAPVPADHRVRRLANDEADASALAALRDACAPEEWEHSGVEVERRSVFAFVEAGGILCAASWQERGRLRHVGIVTHPAWRGRGLAREVGATITRHAVESGAIAQWQTLVENAPSLAVGRRIGFVERYRSIAVRLVGEGPA